ncbi:MAG: sulfatase-like hydrolase/transferase [Oligoflexia bacterium]|nr:sulfatase-like hydrolase/transferase [Oligoflexia bacterium]
MDGGLTLLRSALLSLIGSIFLIGIAHFSAPASAADALRPNFLIIITDDQRYDDMPVMEYTHGKIFNEGCNFTKAYVTTPLCCPSRTSILTGKYASQHGVLNNSTPIRSQTTFPQILKREGYYTGLVGKFLNSSLGLPRPEYDFWASFRGGNPGYDAPLMNINGVVKRERGYSTYIFRDYALKFLDQAAQQPNPFMLYLAFNAPHRPASPAPEDREAKLPLHTKQARIMRRGSRLQLAANSQKLEPYRGGRGLLRHRLTLLAVDRSIRTIIETLKSKGILDNTVVFFISDNGLFRGEHRLLGKLQPYEEAVHVPFAVRYPPVFEPQRSTRLVANIDIAPTILQLAGIPIPSDMAGRSLTDAVSAAEWRKELLLEGFSRSKRNGHFVAIHTGDTVLIRRQEIGQPMQTEVFDMRTDASQLHNLATDTTKAALISDLNARLDTLMFGIRGSTAPAHIRNSQ